jgi:lipoyl(octanoyl) transferase
VDLLLDAAAYPELGSDIEIAFLGLTEYQVGLERQQQEFQRVLRGEIKASILILEHPPTFTAGRRTNDDERPSDGTPVIDVDRGGKITWHGPGQLVVYPIIELEDRFDVVKYVRTLERLMIDVIAELGAKTIAIPGRSGVWFPPDRKVAAIGVRIAQGITTHGFAINCNPDLSWFDRIVPCGIRDAAVTSLSRELNRDISPKEITPLVLQQLSNYLPELMKK